MGHKMILALLLTAVFSGAALAETKSDFDRNFDFSRLRTWDFKAATRIPNDPVAQNELWDRRIRAGLISHFTEVSFARVENGEPTFLVDYFMDLEKRYEVPYIEYGAFGRYESLYRYGRWYDWDPSYGHVGVWTTPYTDSTMIVDVIDSRTKHLVWRGYDTQTIDFEKSEKSIHKSVENLTRRFRHDVNKQLKQVL